MGTRHKKPLSIGHVDAVGEIKEEPRVDVVPAIDITVNTIFVPGWYRAVVDDDPIPIGELVYASHSEPHDYRRNDPDTTETERVSFICLDREFTNGLQAFQERYEYIPDGAAIRQQQMQAASDEIKDLSTREVELNRQALAFTPHVAADGSFATTALDTAALDGSDPGMTLIATKSTPILTKKALATFRNEVTKLKNSVVDKSKHLQRYIKEQQTIMAAKLRALTDGINGKVTQLQKLVEKAQEAIWTINLYLGKDEEIVPLRKGKAAPADTPVTVRQLVMFMDEECLVAADHGGIDARKINNFDHWLTSNKAHLQQVLPDQKGIVALKPRRHGKNYGDPWVNDQMDKANKQTYFLIRNGQNLYRVMTEFDVGRTLLPSESEFLEVFYSNDYDWKTNKRVERPIMPGSKEYMDAMGALSEQRRHYFRMALILQGLLDRTKILHPLPVPRLNVLDPSDHAEHLRFIYDAEMTNMLPDGHPKYADWLVAANATIGVGQRVMGFFNYGYGRDSEKSRRVQPPTASNPDSLTLYTLDCRGDKPDSYYFYYQRSDTIYRRGWREESGPSKVRARCTIYSNDKNILNFDAPGVTIDVMEYYIKSRLHRHAYIDMVPLLQRAIEIKKREIKEEAPFHILLAGEIMKTYDVPRETAEEAVPDLVHWWKFKNQTHRALLSDDAAALKMIVDEFDIRRKRALERLGIHSDPLVQRLVDTVRASSQHIMLIAHKKSNEYVVLIAHNNEDVFVTEQLWTINRSSNCPNNTRVRLKKSDEWRLVDTRWERWQVLYQHERWVTWLRGAAAKGYLTDPERQLALESAGAIVSGMQGRVWSKRDRSTYDADDWKDGYLPLAVTLRHDNDVDSLMVYYCDREAILPISALIKDRPYEPSIAKLRIVWKRNAQGEATFELRYDRHSDHITTSLHKPCWRLNTERSSYHNSEDDTVKVLREWPENIQRIYEQQRLYSLCSERTRALETIASQAEDSIEEQIDKLAWDQAEAEYVAEFGDPELWDEHKKTVRIKPRRYKSLRRLLGALIESNVDCNNMTLHDVFEKAGPLLVVEDKEEKARRKQRGHYCSSSDDEEVLDKLHPDDANLRVSHPSIPQEPLHLGIGPEPEPDDD